MSLNRIDLNGLMIFHTVVEQGSIQKSKDMLRRTQPAITLRLNKLEDELGKKLFLQKKPALKLTPEGQVLFKFTTAMKRLLEKSPMAKRGGLSNFRYPLRIGTYTSVAAFCLPAAISKTAASYKDVLFSTAFDDPYELFQRLKMGGLDMMVIPKHYQPSTDIKMIFSVPQNYFALIPHGMKYEKLSDLKWCFYTNPKDLQLQTLNNILLEHVPKPDIRWETTKLTSSTEAVEAQVAAAVVPGYVLCRKITQSHVIPLESKSTTPIPLEAFVRPDFETLPNAAAISHLAQSLEKLLIQVNHTKQ